MLLCFLAALGTAYSLPTTTESTNGMLMLRNQSPLTHIDWASLNQSTSNVAVLGGSLY
jgi:hypothetical protein